MTPVSAISQQPVFSSSPVDTTSYSTDAGMGSAYFTQEPQNLGTGDMRFDTGNGMQFQQPSAYNEMAYLSNPQHSYPFHNQ
jgi:hypothetical protein